MKIEGKTAIYELTSTADGFLTIKKTDLKTGMLEDDIMVSITELDMLIHTFNQD